MTKTFSSTVPDTVAYLLDKIERLDVDGAQGRAPMLPEACYTSADFFDFERSAVFATSWCCVGRAEQIPNTGDYLAATVADEPLVIVRREGGEIAAMSAVCQHRGNIIVEAAGNTRLFRCPLHYWTYDLEGRLQGAPRMGDRECVQHLSSTVVLPEVRLELWHGFIFVNLDAGAAPLAPGLAKLEPYWQNYEQHDLVAVPPVISDNPLPWNWKIHAENFTDAYHPEFVHRGTHDFAPSNDVDGGVAFTSMAEGDNAIVRSVPMRRPDGGMMADGWGEAAQFPPMPGLSAAQRKRLTFAMLPPSMTLMFSPGAVSYQLMRPTGVRSTLAANDRVTGGGWLLPRTTLALPDFEQRAANVRLGGSKIWAQDVPINLAMQAGKRSRFSPQGIYGPLEVTLQQFNAWLCWKYQAHAARVSAPSLAVPAL